MTTAVEPGRRYRLPNGMIVHGLSESDTLCVYRDLFEDQCYLRHGVGLRDGDCVLDVGANTGLFALYLNAVLRRARVYSFEPIPAIHAALVRNLREHDRLGAEAFNVGLSDRDGQADFLYFPKFSNASSMHPDGSARRVRTGRDYVLSQVPMLPAPLPYLISWLPDWVKEAGAEAVRRYHMSGQRVSCRLWTLSRFLRERKVERVDLLKIDAERSERQILAGLDDADWPRIRQVVVETHDGPAQTHGVLTLLRNRGFRATAGPNPALPDLDLVYAVREGE